MTVSMRVMSAGDGYKYLLKTVVAADGNRPLSTPLTRYYKEEGHPAWSLAWRGCSGPRQGRDSGGRPSIRRPAPAPDGHGL